MVLFIIRDIGEDPGFYCPRVAPKGSCRSTSEGVYNFGGGAFEAWDFRCVSCFLVFWFPFILFLGNLTLF